MIPPSFLSGQRVRRLGTLLAVLCVSAGVIAIGEASSGEAAAPQADHRRAAPSASPSVEPAPTKTALKTSARPVPQVKSARCTGRAKNMFFTAAGGSVTEPSSQPPAYLRIKKASVVRDSKGVTVSYTLAGNAPEPGSDADATYWTWLGDGLDDMDEPAVSMQYLDSRWFVHVSGTNDVVGGDVEARPEIHGHTVSVRLPLRVSTSSGYVADLSKFTHAGWSTEGKDPSGFGTWMDGCPISGEEAGNPGSWEVALH
ncbi:hypothetical protein [Streptomyces sp. NPDC001816]|uniref:hypothetical protein n=1 Tax=Streptomyces sp. NPDC001816 TaxID=3364612 RepID=UPI0036CEED7A